MVSGVSAASDVGVYPSVSARINEATNGQSVCAGGIDLLPAEPRSKNPSGRDPFGIAIISQGENVPIQHDEIRRLAHLQRAGVLQIQHAGTVDGVGVDNVADGDALLRTERWLAGIAA